VSNETKIDAFSEFAKDVIERLSKISPPEGMTELRREYWKAGARAAVRAVNESLSHITNKDTP